MSRITVKIGKFETTYELYETNAPAIYDRGGTFTLHDYSGETEIKRFILIPLRQVADQLGRNASGLHHTARFEISEHGMLNHCTTILLNRMRGAVA